VKNYFSKNASSLRFDKIADDAESMLSRPGTAPLVSKTETLVEMSRQSDAPPSVLPPLQQPVFQPSEPSQPYRPSLPLSLQAPAKALPTVASMLNSPVQEISRPDRPWQEPPPTPVTAPINLVPLPMPEESRGIASPTSASEVSRSQSQSDYYSRSEMGRQPSIYSQPSVPVRDDYRYREDSQSQSIPSTRYIPSPQQNLPSLVRIHEPFRAQSPYYQPSPRYDAGMPPPISEPGYVRETYSRSPIDHRPNPAPSPLPHSLPPPSLPPSDTRELYYHRDHDRRPEPPRESRYPPYRGEVYLERDGRDYPYQDEQARYMRDRPFHRERIDTNQIENERMERQRAERERERFIPERDRDPWRDQRYPEYSRHYAPRPRSPGRMIYTREPYELEGWERDDREWERWPRR